MSSDTGRACRRLLRAYPRGPRRAELLGTLLDIAAGSGRSRPTVREAFNLVRQTAGNPTPGAACFLRRRPQIAFFGLAALPVLGLAAVAVPMPWSGAPLAFPACRPPAGPPPAPPAHQVSGVVAVHRVTGTA